MAQQRMTHTEIILGGLTAAIGATSGILTWGAGFRNLLGFRKDRVDSKKANLEIQKLESRIVLPTDSEVQRYDPKLRNKMEVLRRYVRLLLILIAVLPHMLSWMHMTGCAGCASPTPLLPPIYAIVPLLLLSIDWLASVLVLKKTRPN
jgi:hypothetical protein